MAQNHSNTTMDYKAALVNGIDSDSKGDSDAVTSHIRSVPVTVQRKPFLQPEDDVKLSHTGTSLCDREEDKIEAIQELTNMRAQEHPEPI